MKKILILFCLFFISVNVYSQVKSSENKPIEEKIEEKRYKIIDTTVNADFILPIRNKISTTSNSFAKSNTITLPSPADSIKGNIIEVTHKDTTSAGTYSTFVQTDGVTQDLYKTTAGNIAIDTITINGQKKRYTLQEIDGSLKWVSENMIAIVQTDEEISEAGVIGVDGDDNLSAYDNSVSGERKLQYQYTVNNVQEILNMKLRLGDRVKVKSTGAEYVVFDTTYTLTSPGGARSYGTTDTLTRVQTNNSLFAHLQPNDGKIKVSQFVQKYSGLETQRQWFNRASFDDTKALQHAADYVASLNSVSEVHVDIPYLTITDTVVFISGSILSGSFQGGNALRQIKNNLNGVLFCNFNDQNKDALTFTRNDPPGNVIYSGYSSQTGIKNIAIIALSPARAAVVLAESQNPVAERFLISGKDEPGNADRFFSQGLATYGMAGAVIKDFAILNCNSSAIKTRPWFFAQTTSTVTNGYCSSNNHGLDTREGGGFYLDNTIFEQSDSCAIIGKGFRSNQLYVENTPSVHSNVPTIIIESGDVFIEGGVIGGPNSTNERSDYLIYFTDSNQNAENSVFERVRIGGSYDDFIRVGASSLSAISLIDVIPSGIYQSVVLGKNPNTKDIKVEVQNYVLPSGEVLNRTQNQTRFVSADSASYYYSPSLFDTMSIGRNYIVSLRQNLIAENETIYPNASGGPIFVNSSRVAVVDNDTLFDGELIADKLTKISNNAAIISINLDTEQEIKPGNWYYISFQYANNSFDDITVRGGGFDFDFPVIESSSYTKIDTFFQATEVDAEVQLVLNGSIGDSIHIARIMIKEVGPFSIEENQEYIKNEGASVKKRAIWQGDSLYFDFEYFSSRELDALQTQNPKTLSTIQTSDFTAEIGVTYQVDCSSGPITITPPSSPPVNGSFRVIDVTGNAGVNNITLAFQGSGTNIYSQDVDYIINYNEADIIFTYHGATTGFTAKQ